MVVAALLGFTGAGSSGAVVKLALVVLLQFTTAPIGAHLVGRAAFRTGRDLRPDTFLDEESGELGQS